MLPAWYLRWLYHGHAPTDQRYLQPFTNNFPRADIYATIAPDILHQVVKGCFKDHLVDWVVEYIKGTYVKSAAERILADIDRRCVAI